MQSEFFGWFFAGVLRIQAYICYFTQFTVDQSKLTVNGSVLSDTPNVRYLVALYEYRQNSAISQPTSNVLCVLSARVLF